MNGATQQIVGWITLGWGLGWLSGVLFMRFFPPRRHHNNDGRRQIRTGATGRFVARLARSLGVPVRGSTNTGPVGGREKP